MIAEVDDFPFFWLARGFSYADGGLVVKEEFCRTYGWKVDALEEVAKPKGN